MNRFKSISNLYAWTLRSLCLALSLGLISCQGPLKITDETQFENLKSAYITAYKPLMIQASNAWWDAATTGTDDAYARRQEADKAIAELHSNKTTFEQLKGIRSRNHLSSNIAKRELEVLYHSFLSKQADPDLTQKIIELKASVDKIFNTHRSLVDGQRMTENDVRKILKETTDTELAKKAWSGYMVVGKKVSENLKELVLLRNELAKGLGYENFFAMRLAMQELEEEELFKIFDELDELTREPFQRLKDQIDEHMMKRFSLKKEELRPWHTADLFFQEAPDIGGINLDSLYQGKDPVKISEAHYVSMGMPVEDILKKSDLYEKEGKSPHAFCSCVDRDQDIRVLCNVKPNANWMDTMHHELGHGVYCKYISDDAPFLLHVPSHILTTEGMAMLFGALTKNGDFLKKGVGIPEAEFESYAKAARSSLRAEKLIFSRWTQVMLRFERGMYKNPEQDLNKLWWDLKKKYQLLNPPDDMSGADYGAKIHVVGAPIYYHNYMLGDLFASQVWCYAAKKAGFSDPHQTSFWGDKKTGKYFIDEIFGPGNLYHWQELLRRSTGEKLSARYYASLYVD